MNLSFDFNKMRLLLSSFDHVSGLRYSLSDPECNFLCSSNEMSRFCSIINATECGHQMCIKSDKKALVEIQDIRQPYYTYRCHAGILNTLIPLLHPKTGVPFAYIYFGQMIKGSDIEGQWKYTCEKTKWKDDEAALEAAFHLLEQVDDQYIDSCAEILTACYSYIWMDGVVKMSNMTESELLAQYIDTHYMEPITLDMIANELSVSKTKLCNIAAKQGTTIMSMITIKRMEVAKKLLKYNNYYISDIAFLVGISDYNYFSKLFRKTYGISPREYRKQLNPNPPQSQTGWMHAGQAMPPKLPLET